MFDIKFLIFFKLVPLRHIYHKKNIGFQQPMCQFVSKFVLGRKFVPLFKPASIVDKRQEANFKYGHRKKNKERNHIARQFLVTEHIICNIVELQKCNLFRLLTYLIDSTVIKYKSKIKSF